MVASAATVTVDSLLDDPNAGYCSHRSRLICRSHAIDYGATAIVLYFAHEAAVGLWVGALAACG
jgi:hypothetical protein